MSEDVNQATDNKMAKRKIIKRQTLVHRDELMCSGRVSIPRDDAFNNSMICHE
jgi:hypothetical protein